MLSTVQLKYGYLVTYMSLLLLLKLKITSVYIGIAISHLNVDINAINIKIKKYMINLCTSKIDIDKTQRFIAM